MVRPQVVVRIPPELFSKFDRYMEETGESKTEVMLSALAQYLGCMENLPLSQRIAKLEARMAILENSIYKSSVKSKRSLDEKSN